jgi:large subunit ribosomal protein L23
MQYNEIIIRPIVSEKSYVLANNKKYTFRVHPDAHKTAIKQAIEHLFDVKVLGICTATHKGKPKRRGTTRGKTRKWKKAIVQVRKGDHIPVFQGLEGEL